MLRPNITPAAEDILRNSTSVLFKRYQTILTDFSNSTDDPMAGDARLSIVNLIWICQEARSTGDRLPLDKLSRWLGFVQGCLAMRGLCQVDDEREISRPMFRSGYDLIGGPPTAAWRSPISRPNTSKAKTCRNKQRNLKKANSKT